MAHARKKHLQSLLSLSGVATLLGTYSSEVLVHSHPSEALVHSQSSIYRYLSASILSSLFAAVRYLVRRSNDVQPAKDCARRRQGHA